MLIDYEKRYEAIMFDSDTNKDKKLSDLMTEMEKEYQIPMIRKAEWEKENRKVIALYRKISMSRTFD